MNRSQDRLKRRFRSHDRKMAVAWFDALPMDVVSSLMGTPHPKLSGELYPDVPHSLWTYVMWLCQHNKFDRAKELVYGN